MKQEFMKKELRGKVKELNKGNINVLIKIDNRLSGSDLHKKAYKEHIREILDMLIEGQKRNQSYKEVIGENLDEFCENIIENSYKTNEFERILRIIYIISIVISIPVIIVLLLILLVFKENLFLLAYQGQIGEIDVMPYFLSLIMGFIYLYIHDLYVRKSLKKSSIKVFLASILVMLIYLGKFSEKGLDSFKISYMMDVNYYLVTFILLFIIIFYHSYNFIVLRQFKNIKS